MTLFDLKINKLLYLTVVIGSLLFLKLLRTDDPIFYSQGGLPGGSLILPQTAMV